MHINRIATLAATLQLAACIAPQTGTVFEFEHPDGDRGRATLVAVTDDPAVIATARAELAKPPAQRTLHINGPIARGDGNHNRGWRWHFKPNEWTLAGISIELCDGRPSYVDEHLDEWLRDVGRFCPWSSRIAR
jgi:hypothetical protein